MFRIDTNLTIRMSKGEDIKFPLFLNKGTEAIPIRYTFTGCYGTVFSIPIRMKNAHVNQKVWKSIVKDAGEYRFIYNSGNWTLNSEVVNLSDYGITITMKFNPETGNPYSLENNDTIKIVHTEDDGCEVYLKIFNINSNEPIFQKTFTSRDDLWINEDGVTGDMKIELLHTDPLVDATKTLEDLYDSEYLYQISAKVKDEYYKDEVVYMNIVATNKLRLYIIDDNYSSRTW